MDPYIYIITNNINNKTYVGKASGKHEYYYTGGVWVKRAIKKYGKEFFTKKILVQGNFNEVLLNELEKHYIWLLSNPKSKKSYNITYGGGGANGYVGVKYWQGKKRTREGVERQIKAVSKKVDQYTLNNVFIKHWDSMSEANRFYKLKSRGVHHASNPNNRKKTAAGFFWKRVIIH